MSKLSAQEMILLKGLKKLILKKIKKGKQMGSGIRAGDVIKSVINFIEKIGVPLNKITWNLFIIPLMDRLFLRKLDPAVRKSIKDFLKVKDGSGLHRHICCKIVRGHIICPSAGLKLAGQGLRLAGQGITLAGAGKSLGPKRKTLATKILRHKLKKPSIDIQGVRKGLRGLGRKKASKKSKWSIHLKKTFAENKALPFKEVIKLASATFKKK